MFSNRFADAIEDFDRLQKLDPEFNSHFDRGKCYQSLGKHREAIADFDASLQRHPDFSDAFMHRGLSKTILGQKEEADKDFEKTFTNTVLTTNYSIKIGCLLVEFGHAKEGLVWLDAVLAKYPDNQQAQTCKSDLLNRVRAQAKGEASVASLDWQRQLNQLKQRYITSYAALHSQLVLGQDGIDRKEAILRAPQALQLRQLAHIDILNANELSAWETALRAIPTCGEFHVGLLADTPTCPHCQLRAIQADAPHATARLAVLTNRLDTLLAQWHGGLRAALTSDTARQSMAAMTPVERRPLETYLAIAEPAELPPPKMPSKTP